MGPHLALAVLAVKALLLLAAAAAVAVALRGRPARLRAVVWATALAGSLLIPVASPLLPSWAVPVPRALARLTAPEPRPTTPPLTDPGEATAPQQRPLPLADSPDTDRAIGFDVSAWLDLAVWAWLLGTALLLARLGLSLLWVARARRRAPPLADPRWLAQLEHARHRVGYQRPVRLLVSREVEIPAACGVLRPAIVMPSHACTWLDERRLAVLEHELVHLARLDWPARLIARVARAVYWINPLAWWAVRRLDLEQEIACDEEVLALGTRPSTYACHLLGIARSARRCPVPAAAGLGMARRSHLEERIMTMLQRTTHRRAGLALLGPAAVLMAAMVPALAAVTPTDPQPRPSSAELKQILADMKAAEARMEPHLARIEDVEEQMRPHIEKIERAEVVIDHDALAAIEDRMQPYLERIEEIEVDMQPFLARIEELSGQLDDLQIHVEDGTLEEVQRQIHEQIAAHMEQVEKVHVDLEPLQRQIEEIHAQMVPLQSEIERIHVDMEPVHAELERLQQEMVPFHARMEEIHRELEPIHEELERLGDRLEGAIRTDVAAVLREHLGAVTSPAAPIDEAAARIVEEAHVHVRDNVVEVNSSPSEARRILSDLLGTHRVGTQQAFDAAVRSAADALSPLVIGTD